jgi:hypothetical protein
MTRVITLAAILLVSGAAHGQIVVDDGRPPVKERSPELQKLNYMVGTWDTEATAHFTPDAKEFKAKMITVVRWSSSGQFLISDEWSLMPASNGPKGPVPQGWLNKLVVTTWNPIKREYDMVNILSNATYTLAQDSFGEGGIAHGESRDGDHITETWTSFKRVSDTEMKFRTECSIDHGPKFVSGEGVSRKRHE